MRCTRAMLAVFLLLCLLAVCYVAHKLTVYALPCLIGFGVGEFAYTTDAGAAGAIAIGLVGALASFTLLRFAYLSVSTPLARGLVALAFVTPSVTIGFFITYSVASEAIPSGFWRGAISAIVAGFAGLLAFIRLSSTDCDVERHPPSHSKGRCIYRP